MRVLTRGMVNRTLLGSAGLVLLLGGAWLAVGGGSVGNSARDVLPGWWPMPAVDRVLLDRHLLARLRDNGWWSPASVGTLALALALLVWWFTRQLAVGTPRWVEIGSTGVRLRRRAWERALTTQVVAIDTVARARVRLVGRPIRAAVIVTVEPEARPTEVLRGVARVIADARVSGGIPGLPADVRLRVANRPGRRAR